MTDDIDYESHYRQLVYVFFICPKPTQIAADDLQRIKYVGSHQQ